MRWLSAIRAVVAGLIIGTGVGVCSFGCLTPAERRAVSVADCVAQMALALPQQELPDDPVGITEDGLGLAVQVVHGVAACRKANAPPPDGGS
jgi:hypothetical protein